MLDLNLSMFRAYDIRTPAELLTDDLAIRLARAEEVYFREVLGATGVILAHDPRATGPHYLEIAAEQFNRSGLSVIVIPGVCSTSMFYFAAMIHPDLAAVIFGASHNPAGDTGQKILGPGVRPIAEHIGPAGGLDRIKELYQSDTTINYQLSTINSIHAYDPTDEYIDYSMKLAGVEPGSLNGASIMQDYLNGAAGREMMLAFDIAGADLTPVHFAADGRFPLGDPNPVKQPVILDGLHTLQTGDFLLGMFFDGDGDRIDFYRGDGVYVSSSFMYAGVLPDIRRRFHGERHGVFADLKSHPLAVMEMASGGVSVSVMRNGHSQIKEAMYADPSIIGSVEESAHYYEAFPAPRTQRPNDPIARFCTENTLYFALLASRAWMEDPARFDRLIEIQGQTCREREWGYKFPTDAQRAAALHAVRNHFESIGAAATSRTPSGLDLEATLMRRGIPFDIDASTRLDGNWLQVCQRVSQSESGLGRWEVIAANPDIAAGAKRDIARIVNTYGAGEEYQG